MAVLFQIVEGWTKELEAITLKGNGSAIDLTGATPANIELIIKPEKGGAAVPTSGDVRIDADPTTGKIYFKPDADDFKASRSPYTVHVKLTDGNDDVVFFPNGEPDTIEVFAP